jgi:putative flippase GtrA
LFFPIKQKKLILKKENVLFSNGLLTQAIGFGASGIISIGVNFLVTVFLHELVGLPARVAYAFGLSTTIIINFLFIRKVIFRSQRNVNKQFLIFLGSSFAFRGAEWIAFVIIETVADLPYIWVMLCIHTISAVIKFWYYKLFVFK